MKRLKHRGLLSRPVRQPANPLGVGFRSAPAPECPATRKGVRFDLAFPILIGGETRHALVMRSPTPEDLAWFQGQQCDDHEGVFRMISRLCGVPREALDELDRADLVGLFDVCDAVMDEI